MTFILLTGAGFSRNWGGWLANETFEYLLGSAELDGDLRALLWRSKEAGGGFEDALAELQIEYEQRHDDMTKKRLNDLQAAIVGMFNQMDQSFAMTTFEPQQEMNPITPRQKNYVRNFLFRFDAIFTLNQDLLLERHYFDDNINFQQSQKWKSWQIPGMKPLQVSARSDPVRDKVALQTPEESVPMGYGPEAQPYFKLHGSSNWVNGSSGGRLFIMGGNKASEIDRYPILTWYHRQFREYLARPGARLMIIGYSFSDQHINAAIASAVDTGNLRLFIIDPLGVDVIDKRNPRLPIRVPDAYVEKLAPRIIGASRRSLSSTFGNDNVEHGKIMRFFES
jgi:hypothetical protein